MSRCGYSEDYEYGILYSQAVGRAIGGHFNREQAIRADERAKVLRVVMEILGDEGWVGETWRRIEKLAAESAAAPAQGARSGE